MPWPPHTGFLLGSKRAVNRIYEGDGAPAPVPEVPQAAELPAAGLRWHHQGNERVPGGPQISPMTPVRTALSRRERPDLDGDCQGPPLTVLLCLRSPPPPEVTLLHLRSLFVGLGQLCLWVDVDSDARACLLLAKFCSSRDWFWSGGPTPGLLLRCRTATEGTSATGYGPVWEHVLKLGGRPGGQRGGH